MLNTIFLLDFKEGACFKIQIPISRLRPLFSRRYDVLVSPSVVCATWLLPNLPYFCVALSPDQTIPGDVQEHQLHVPVGGAH